MSRDILSGKFTEPELDLLPYLVTDSSIAIDVGSNYGLYLYHLSRNVGSRGFVFGYEPISITFRTLKNVVRHLSLTNTLISNIGLSDQQSTATFEVPVQAGGHLMGGQAHISVVNSFSRSLERRGNQIWAQSRKFRCELDCLDNLLSDDQKSKVSFVKLDTEGSEFLAIDGAMDTLKFSLPNLLVEINPYYLDYFNISLSESLDKLFNIGYHMYQYNHSERLLAPVSIDEVIEANYIFIHDSKLHLVSDINQQIISVH